MGRVYRSDSGNIEVDGGSIFWGNDNLGTIETWDANNGYLEYDLNLRCYIAPGMEDDFYRDLLALVEQYGE